MIKKNQARMIWNFLYIYMTVNYMNDEDAHVFFLESE